MDDPEHHACGAPRVDGIAARFEDARGRLRGERMTGHHHPSPAHDLQHRTRGGRGARFLLGGEGV